MVIDATQKDRIPATGGKIRVRFLALHDNYIGQVPLGHLGSQDGKFFFVNFGGEDFSRAAYELRRSKGVLAVARADVGDDGSRLPLHQGCQPLVFVNGNGLGATQQTSESQCGTKQGRCQQAFSIHCAPLRETKLLELDSNPRFSAFALTGSLQMHTEFMDEYLLVRVRAGLTP